MALRAVPDHPKFANLKAVLSQPKGATLGWLEAVWHFTGRFTPQGNIGKYSDEAIEAWVEWNGEPGSLIESLVRTGWLDRDETHRMLVHDWSQHADKATKNALIRAKLPFYTPTVRTLYVHCTDEKPESGNTYRLPVPVPEPEPVPVPVPEAKTKTPAKGKPSQFTLPEWIKADTWAAFEGMRNLNRWKLTDQARKNIVARLERFKAEGHNPEEILQNCITNCYRGIWPVSKGRDDSPPKPAAFRLTTPEEEAQQLREGYEMWQSMSQAYRDKNPWRGGIPA